jgi:hypothetical protein
MTRLLLLSSLALASTSYALTSSARLLADEAPAAAPDLGPSAPESVDLTPRQAKEPLAYGYQFGAGAVAAVIFVPGSLYLGSWLGNLSNNLIGAAIPTLLCIGLIPPLAITIAEWLAGNWNTPGRYRFWPSFLVNLVVNGVSLAVAANWGLSIAVVERVVLYTIVQAVVQPAGTTLLMRAWPKEEAPKVIASTDPNSPSTFFVPASTWSF